MAENPGRTVALSRSVSFAVSVLRPAVLLLALAALAACDSGSAVDPPSPADVAGTYAVAAFTFEPDAPRIPAAAVADALDLSGTTFQILDGGDVLFIYRLAGGTQRVIQGRVEVRRDEIRVTFDDASASARTRLLLPERLVFDRLPSALLGEADVTANLEAYDPEGYGTDGVFTAVPGTLTLRLTLQASA